MDTVITEEYIIKPEKYLNVILNIFLRRHRITMLLALTISIILSIYIRDFIYAMVVLIFGAFPFVLFHVYFKYAGRYDNKYLFIEKKVEFGENCIAIHPIGEKPVRYTTTQIKYGGFARKNHLLILDGKYMLNIPLGSIPDYDSYTRFENWLNTQISKQTCRK